MSDQDFHPFKEGVVIAPFTRKKAHYELWGKRTLDLAFALVLLPILLPVIALLWLVVRSGGSRGFFGHRRVGRNGKIFSCYKIQTMVADAEGRLTAYLESNPQAAQEWADTQKLTNDPRITKVGKFLRKTSLDELPQIWNVLAGDMSFVGPRPVTAVEIERYGVHRDTYLELKPGITGVWQVEGRSSGDYFERVQMDRKYAATIGIFSDILLIAKTVTVMIQPTGR